MPRLQMLERLCKMDARLPDTETGRAYRSKKQRPCDICRVRRVQCKSLRQPDGSRDTSLCQMCVRLGLNCTFEQGPPRKRCRDASDRPTAESASASARPRPTTRAPISRPSISPAVSPSVSPGNIQHPLPSHTARHVSQASPTQIGRDALSMDLGMDQDHLAMMDWWATMEIPPQEASPTNANVHVPLPDYRFDINNAGLFTRSPLRSVVSPIVSPLRSSIGDGVNDAIPPSAASESSPNAIIASRRLSNLNSSATWPQEFSLESHQGHSHQLLGLSGESDPYFLRHYAYNKFDTYRMFRLHFRKVVDDALVPPPDNPENARPLPISSMPVQFVIADEAIWANDVHSVECIFNGSSTEESDTVLLKKIVPPELAVRLLKLYRQFVHHRYPVLSLHDLERMSEHAHQESHSPAADTGAPGQLDPAPETQVEGWQFQHPNTNARPDGTLSFPVGLRCAVYALAAPFAFLDDQLSVSRGYREGSTDELWAIAHRSFQRASRLSHLSSLQLCLLLLQQPPQSYVAAEPPSFWALSCTSLAIAESLGLGLDPDTWRLPRSEVILRRRLWWLTHTTHVWNAIVFGRPLHIHKDDWDVAPLRPADFESGDGGSADQVAICIAECELGLIASDVLKAFYTLRGTRGEPPTLSSLLARAQPLRTRIDSWRLTLPLLSKPASDLTDAEFENGAALRLAHLTLELLIFRALLRPLTIQAINAIPIPTTDKSREPISAIFDNGYNCARAVAGMVSSLQAKHFANFWPLYVRHQLCYVAPFLLMNLAQSPTEPMAARYLALLDQWRRTLRIVARAWPLARLAAMRLDAITWKGIDTVVHGAGQDSPAMALIRQPDGGAGARQEV